MSIEKMSAWQQLKKTTVPNVNVETIVEVLLPIKEFKFDSGLLESEEQFDLGDSEDSPSVSNEAVMQTHKFKKNKK